MWQTDNPLGKYIHSISHQSELDDYQTISDEDERKIMKPQLSVTFDAIISEQSSHGFLWLVNENDQRMQLQLPSEAWDWFQKGDTVRITVREAERT